MTPERRAELEAKLKRLEEAEEQIAAGVRRVSVADGQGGSVAYAPGSLHRLQALIARTKAELGLPLPSRTIRITSFNG